MPPVGAAIGAIGSVIGGAAAGAAGLAAGAASAIGSVASGVLGGAAGLAGGAISALTGGVSAQAAVPVMVGGEMGSLAAASTLGVPAATAGVATGLSTLTTAVSAGVGLYGQLANIERAKELTEAEKIKQQTALMEAEALKIYAGAPGAAPKTAVPTLAAQPIYVTPAAAPAKPNYLLYAGLAILAYLLLGKK